MGSSRTLLSGTDPSGIDVGLDGSLYVAASNSTRINRVNPIDGSFAGLFIPMPSNSQYASGVAVSPNGTVYTSSFSFNVIFSITSQGAANIYAGNRGNPGTTSDRLNTPYALTLSHDGTLYVTDAQHGTIRLVTPQGVIKTLAGATDTGFVDGNGTVARFENSGGINIGPDGTIYVADQGNNALRQIEQYRNFYDITLNQSLTFVVPPTLVYSSSGNTFSDAVGLTMDDFVNSSFVHIIPDTYGPNLSVTEVNITNDILTITITSNETTAFTLDVLRIDNGTDVSADAVLVGNNTNLATFTYNVRNTPISGNVTFNITGTDIFNNPTTIEQIEYIENLNVTRPFISTTLRSLDAKPGYHTSLSTLNYSVTFNASVTGFNASSIIISGSANNSKPEISNFEGSGASYTFEVQRGKTDGNVTVGIPYGAISMGTRENNASNNITVSIDTARACPISSISDKWHNHTFEFLRASKEQLCIPI